MEQSDSTEEDQSTCSLVPEKNNYNIDDDNGSDSGDCCCCLDLTDPNLIKMFAQPKLSEDLLYVSFYRYQRNKRNLLKLLSNFLQYA